jgi:tape measure domain-containing protein
MDNKLEYIISLIDKATAPMAKFGQSAIAHFTKIDNAQKKFAQQNELAGKSFNSLGKAIESLKAKAHGIEIVSNSDIAKVRAMNSAIKDLERQQNKIGNMNGSKLKGWASDAASQIPGAGLISNPLVMAGTAVAGMLKFGSDQQQSKVKFQTLMGSANGGNKMFGDMQQYAAKTTFRQKDVQDAGLQLLNRGVAKENIMPTMKMLGDIAGDDANKLQSLALAFGQMTGAQHLKGQDLNQMIDAGFNPLLEISKMTGESMESLSQKMEDGAISTDMVAKAMEHATGPTGLYFGMQDKLSKTFGGKLSTFLDKFSVTVATLGEKILPIASAALDVINGALEFLVDNGDVILGVIGMVGLSMLIAGGSATGYAIGMELASIATNIASSAVYKFGVALLTTPIGWLCIAIGAVIIIIRKWVNHFGSAAEAWKAFGKIMMQVWEIIKTGFSMYIDNIVLSFEIMFYKIIGFFDRMAQKALNVGRAIKEGLSGNFVKAGEYWNAQETSRFDTKADALTKVLIGKNIDGASKIAGNLKAINGVWDSGKGAKEDTKDAAYKAQGAKASGGKDDKDKGSTKGATDAITGGGVRNMYISLGKFQDSINIHVGSAKEGINQMSDAIQDELLRILNSAGALQQ